jgi:hydrogenase maturation protein HypF
LTGWVLNAEQGVEIHLEGAESELEAFVHDLERQPPPAATIAAVEVQSAEHTGVRHFSIRESRHRERSSTRISPDLPVCEACLAELFDPQDPRHAYPYINCTNCGPRYSVIQALPYDRCNTTMSQWQLDGLCRAQYEDPCDRRFHAQPVACAACGPKYRLLSGEAVDEEHAAIRRAAELLRAGAIVAVKGLGGYHLACDARNAHAVRELRERKFRKEKPFALMVPSVDVARDIVELSAPAEALLVSSGRPIVLARAKEQLDGVAPDTRELGLMLPYTPLHYLLYAAGAPQILIMTSANRSSEPIAYDDADALKRLAGTADAFLIGERPIARRIEDSVARYGAFGASILRRSRGYAPGAVATLPTEGAVLPRAILAVGADLKNTITLVVEGQAFISQHIGDLEDYQSLLAFRETIQDLISMYEVAWDDLTVVHDCHPQYASTLSALDLPAAEKRSVQHHRAHVASVLAERGEWEQRVLGISFDGTGYGDDGTIWGGEIFLGSVAEGFSRIAGLRPAALPGGDAAARYPVQAAAGFLAEMDGMPDFAAQPFNFPARYQRALQLARKHVRTFRTTSVGRLFDAAAALLGFTRETSFEGQAAMWLEQLARGAAVSNSYEFPFTGLELDYRPLLRAVAQERLAGGRPAEIARAFQRGVAEGLSTAARQLCSAHAVRTIVLSGGVFQNELLLEDLKSLLGEEPLEIWTNHAVPPNDGGISLGQAALAAFSRFNSAAAAELH